MKNQIIRLLQQQLTKFPVLSHLSYGHRHFTISIIFHYLSQCYVFKLMSDQLNQRLIIQEYNPFKSPPDFTLAQTHKQAMSVGFEQQSLLDCVRCPCCHHSVNKITIPLCIEEENLSFLGVGYPLYFRLTKYYAWLILLVFIFSGSAYYFLVTLQCKINCVRFFGITIINLEQSMPDESTRKTEWFNFCTCLIILAGILNLKPKIKNDIDDFKARLWCPSFYTVMLQNLPENATEEEIKGWITQLANEQPVKINLTYQINAYKEAYDSKETYLTTLNKCKFEQDSLLANIPVSQQKRAQLEAKIKSLQSQIEKQDKIIKEFNTQKCRPVPAGTAFVTFNSKSTCETLIQSHGDSFWKGVFNCFCGIIKSPYPVFHKQNILICSAPSPTDVIWENLHFSFIRNIFFQLLALIVMGVIILLAFKFQYFMVAKSLELKKEGQQNGKFLVLIQAGSMSIIVMILNSLLRLVIEQFSKIQKYHSFTKFNSVFCNNYFLLYFFNTSFTVYIVHGNWIDDSNQLLLWDIHLIMLTNAFSEPLFKLVNPMMWLRYLQRLRIKSLRNNPYTQKYIHSLWEGHPISTADNYQYITRMLYITVWFAYPAPLGIIFSLIALIINYWIDKIFLLRVYRFPEAINESITTKLLFGLEALPLVYMCGTLQYCYKVGTSSNVIEFVTTFLSYGIVFLVVILTLLGYAFFYRREFGDIRPSISFKQAQYLFTFDYDTENPITKYHSEISFLKKLLESNILDESRNSQVLNIIEIAKRQSKEDFQNCRADILNLKKMLASQKRFQQHHSSVVEMSNIVPR